MSSLPSRVDALEQATAELARAQVRAEQNLDQLSHEMRAFKYERAFKDDRRAAEARMNRRWGGLANKIGTLAEDIVLPGIPTIFLSVFGYSEEPSTTVLTWRGHRSDSTRRRAFEALACARDVVLVTETKRQLKPEDLQAFETRLLEARDYLPEAEGRSIAGALATFFYVDPSLVRDGENRGFLMLGISQGQMEILNSPGFRPREF